MQVSLNVDDAAKAIGISRNKLFREIRNGKLVARKIGRRTIILQSDIQAYVDALPRRATNAAGGA